MKKLITLAVILCMGMTLFAACGGSGSVSGSASANPGNVYRVITCDESGAPVAGVMIQFCNDQMCQMGETDADGIAVFDTAEGDYYIHVYSVPEGYAEDDTEYPVPESYGDVNITVKAAE